MKRYKFQALVTLDPAVAAATVRPGQPASVRGEHHETHGSQVFSALVTRGKTCRDATTIMSS